MVIFLAFVNQACNSIKIPQEDRITLDGTNISKLNGRYRTELPSGCYQGTVLWKYLKPFYRGVNKSYGVSNANSEVELKLLSSHLIQFNYYIADSLKESKVLRCRNKDGVIKIRGINNMSIQGIPLLFFRQERAELNFALDKDSNLIMWYDVTTSGGILIVIFGNSDSGILHFSRNNPN